SVFPFSDQAFDKLFDASRKRSEAWFARMQSLKAGAHCWNSLYDPTDDCRRPLIEEILISEILTRVLAGLLHSSFDFQGNHANHRRASELMHHSQESRRLALEQMVEMADAQNPIVRKLDRLRRSAERWTDRLLGPIACRVKLDRWLFDPPRSIEFGETILRHLATPVGNRLFVAGLRIAFPPTVQGVPSHSGLHREFAQAVLGLLSPELFETNGELHPLRTLRALANPLITDQAPAKPTKASNSPQLPNAVKPVLPKISFHKLRRESKNP
ncbi:MAG: hypothetical protein KDA84_25860, partial [Planctomycetaceae bacterium]|nr:hypothetical protein [Planctomycetaceae bacterium]